MDTNLSSNSADENATWIVSDDPSAVQAPSSVIEDDASGVFQAFSSDQQPLLTAMHHLGLPLITFGGCLCVLMIALMLLFTPDRFPVRIGDQTIPLAALTDERDALRREESRLLDERRGINQLVPTPTLHQVRQLAHQFPPVGLALGVLSSVKQSFIVNGLDPVHIDTLQVDTSGKRILVSGRMVDASRSVEMLASFVDNLRQSTVFASVSEPEYVVEHGADSSIFSPFSISLVLSSVHG